MHEPAVGDILEDWLAARDADQDIAPAEVIRANPKHRQQLERCFAAQARLRARGAAAVVPDPGMRLRTALRERYADFHLLGVGGMGIVYRATDLRLNAEVALKILRIEGGEITKENAPASPFDLAPPPPGSPAAQAFEPSKARFLQEVSITGSLGHPNIVPIYDVAQTDNGIPFYTMRYYRGLHTLASAMEALHEPGPAHRLTLLESYLKLCDTIHYAHSKGVVHRDLKPENVLLGVFGEVIVVDWGLATLQGTRNQNEPAWKQRIWSYRRSRNEVTQPGALGTRGYMAPEVDGAASTEADIRLDVYSLGAILFEILNGCVPHEADGDPSTAGAEMDSPVRLPAEFHPATPRGLQHICTRAMAPIREDRYKDAGALADAIRAWRFRIAARDVVDASLDATDAALHVAEGLRGEERMMAAGYARELLAPSAALEPPDPRVQAHTAQIDDMWAQGLKEHGVRRRRRDLLIIVLLALVTVIALGAAMCAVFRVATIEPVASSLTAQPQPAPLVVSRGTEAY